MLTEALSFIHTIAPYAIIVMCIGLTPVLVYLWKHSVDCTPEEAAVYAQMRRDGLTKNDFLRWQQSNHS